MAIYNDGYIKNIQFKRGASGASFSAVTPLNGEPLFVTDTHEFYIGQGGTKYLMGLDWGRFLASGNSGKVVAVNAAENDYVLYDIATVLAGKADVVNEYTVTVTAVVTGGSGYAVGDEFAIAGVTGGPFTVASVSGGSVTAVAGTGKSPTSLSGTKTTTVVTGSGDGALTVTVNTSAAPPITLSDVLTMLNNYVLISKQSSAQGNPAYDKDSPVAGRWVDEVVLANAVQAVVIPDHYKGTALYYVTTSIAGAATPAGAAVGDQALYFDGSDLYVYEWLGSAWDTTPLSTTPIANLSNGDYWKITVDMNTSVAGDQTGDIIWNGTNSAFDLIPTQTASVDNTTIVYNGQNQLHVKDYSVNWGQLMGAPNSSPAGLEANIYDELLKKTNKATGYILNPVEDTSQGYASTTPVTGTYFVVGDLLKIVMTDGVEVEVTVDAVDANGHLTLSCAGYYLKGYSGLGYLATGGTGSNLYINLNAATTVNNVVNLGDAITNLTQYIDDSINIVNNTIITEVGDAVDNSAWGTPETKTAEAPSRKLVADTFDALTVNGGDNWGTSFP